MVRGSELNYLCKGLLGMLKITNSDLDSLPDDLLIQILILVPAQDIHDSAMLVCRKWFEIIRTRSFIYTHLLHHSSPELLLHNPEIKTIPSLISSTKGNQFKTSKLFMCYNNNNNNNNSKQQRFWSSCNGLMLERNIDDNLALTITNPVTNQRFTLPPFTAPINHCQYPTHTSAIAYDATRKDYKVVRTYYLRVHTYNPTAPRNLTHDFCDILTVGVDNSWRHVDTTHLSRTTSKQLRGRPLVTEGFVHWTRGDTRYVLTMNIETEVITRIPVPAPPRKGRGCYLTGKKSYLSLLICRACLKWEVWEMKPETGEWKKLPGIDLEPHKALLDESCDCRLIPAGWLKYREIIVFVAYMPSKLGGGFFRDDRYELRIVYNIQTREISLFKADYSSYTPFLVHKKSLVRIPS